MHRKCYLKKPVYTKDDNFFVDFDTAEKCTFFVETIKAKNSQKDFLSIFVDNLKDDFVLVFDLTFKFFLPKKVIS